MVRGRNNAAGRIASNGQQRLAFTLKIDMTQDLAKDATTAAVGITITSRADGAVGGPSSPAAEIFIMDRSGSMRRYAKLPEAKRAVKTAIDALRDDTYFAVIGGDESVETIYPANGLLARITAATRDAAKREVDSQSAAGGTRIGLWLSRAAEMFAQVPGLIRHAVLYTDGINEHETETELDKALSACRDQFMCDVRGLGTDWDYRELLKIANALQGTAEAVVEVADLTEDFARLMAKAQRLIVPAVQLRISPDHRFRLEAIRQVRPTEQDLIEHRLDHGDDVIDIPLGTWGPETREYLLRLAVDPAGLPTGEELQAARVDLLAIDGPDTAPRKCVKTASVVVQKTNYTAQRTRLPDSLTRLENELARGAAERAGIDAFQRRDEELAAREFAKAHELAKQAGNRKHMAALRKLIIIDDDGRPHLRDDIDQTELKLLGLQSTQNSPETTPQRDAAKPVTRQCTECGEWCTGVTMNVCEACGHPFPDAQESAGS